MVGRSKQPIEVPPGFLLGASIDLSSWQGGELVVDLAGNVHCYVGYTREDQPLDLPWYAPCVALRDKGGRSSYRFVELRRGMLRRSAFLRENDHYYVLSDRWLILPRGADSYFGIIDQKSREEDIARTREVFGGTRSDIELVATALSKIIGRSYQETLQLPRVTFSKTRSNSCDISGCLIPKDFPYLAFDASPYDWSHMSLHAFYRLLAFFCASERANPVRRALVESGVSEEVLNVLLKAAAEYAHPLPFPRYSL